MLFAELLFFLQFAGQLPSNEVMAAEAVSKIDTILGIFSLREILIIIGFMVTFYLHFSSARTHKKDARAKAFISSPDIPRGEMLEIIAAIQRSVHALRVMVDDKIDLQIDRITTEIASSLVEYDALYAKLDVRLTDWAKKDNKSLAGQDFYNKVLVGVETVPERVQEWATKRPSLSAQERLAALYEVDESLEEAKISLMEIRTKALRWR